MKYATITRNMNNFLNLQLQRLALGWLLRPSGQQRGKCRLLASSMAAAVAAAGRVFCSLPLIQSACARQGCRE